MSQKTRTLYRCPVCSKLAADHTFHQAGSDGHELDAMILSFVGGGRAGRPKDDDGKLVPGAKGRGFLWKRRELSADEKREIARVATVVAARLMREVIDDAAGSQDFERVVEEIDAHLEEQLDDLKERVAKARREHQRILLDS